ncbi:MAG: hypothetical protein U0105_11965 [Candidatus Obscuribacterales bacterium]
MRGTPKKKALAEARAFFLSQSKPVPDGVPSSTAGLTPARSH